MVSLLYAGLLCLFYMVLTFYTINGRFKYRISLGHGGNDDMLHRMRAHANFMEYTPLALILLILLELQGFQDSFIHIMGIGLLVGRVIHGLKLSRLVNIPYGRQIGMLTTLMIIVLMACMGIFSYFTSYLVLTPVGNPVTG